MSFKEINDLRKTGNLEEALAKGVKELQQAPDDIWCKRALSWVYYEYLKIYAKRKSFNLFLDYLVEIQNLNLSAEDNMIFNACVWPINALLKEFKNDEYIDFERINKVFEAIKSFHFTRPSTEYSILFKSFHSLYKNGVNYQEFTDWWGLDNFMPEDYNSQYYNNRKIMSLVEQTYIVYSKKLLEGEVRNDSDLFKVLNKEKALAFLPLLNKLIELHPEYEYPTYYKVKLLLALDLNDKALTEFIPFAKSNKNQFWVWEMLAELFIDNEALHFACYCKALSLNSPEAFLVKIRQHFISLLVSKKMYTEARTEIDKLIALRKENGWRIPQELSQYTQEKWYSEVYPLKNNIHVYKDYLSIAENIIWTDVPEEVIVVEYVNSEKRMLNFIKDKSKKGFFNYSGILKKPKIGDLLLVRFQDPSRTNGFFKLETVRDPDAIVHSEAMRFVDDILKIAFPQKFGFIGDIYVDPKQIETYDLSNGQRVKGRAILSFNSKKQKWGWRMLTVTKD